MTAHLCATNFEILNEQPDIEVVSTARNGLDALKKLERYQVDVVTLDLEMPVLDGVATIERIMATHLLPILVISNWAERSLKPQSMPCPKARLTLSPSHPARFRLTCGK